MQVRIVQAGNYRSVAQVNGLRVLCLQPKDFGVQPGRSNLSVLYGNCLGEIGLCIGCDLTVVKDSEVSHGCLRVWSRRKEGPVATPALRLNFLAVNEFDWNFPAG